MKWYLLIFVSIFATFAHAQDRRATTDDGTAVILHADGSWEAIPGSEDSHISDLILELEPSNSKTSYCRAGLRLHNNADYKVADIVFHISAYKAEGTLIETIVVGFNSIPPTRNQAKAIKFPFARCAEIAYLIVHGGDRCKMGELDMFSTAPGECLRRVQLSASSSIEMRKREVSEVP